MADVARASGEFAERNRSATRGRFGQGDGRVRARAVWAAALGSALFPLAACGPRKPETNTLRFLIESSPNNLDLRQGTDAQSERVGGLIFDALVKKDEHYNMQAWLAESWEQPGGLAWVFHRRDGVRFHDGRPLTADDVAYTIESLIDGSLVTAKGGSFSSVDRA